jgi:two-component system invasion response regulator UvrY
MSLQTRASRIIVADDHVVVRKGILQVLQGADDVKVEGEASSGPELLDKLRKEKWDALIMDLHMPGISGMDLLRQVHAIRPGLPVLILTVQPEDLYARRLLQAGASGYLTKESLVDELLVAVRKVCSGKRYVSESLAEQLAFAMDSSSERAPHESLSDREFEVLRLLASGMTPTEIADKLCLSVKTVSTYRTRVLEKMSMKTNADLMRYALKAGLVE